MVDSIIELKPQEFIIEFEWIGGVEFADILNDAVKILYRCYDNQLSEMNQEKYLDNFLKLKTGD
jgi:hypothetical protein